MDSSASRKTRGWPANRAGGGNDPGFPLHRLLLPLAVMALIALVALSLAIDFRFSYAVDELEREYASLPGRRMAEDSRVLDSLLQLQVLSYWLAYPTYDPLVLEPMERTGNAQGVLLTAEDGLSAVLMLAGMEQLPPDSAYEVWLTGEDRRVRAGRLKVDTNGWAATTLYLEEPIFGFDEVQVSANTGAASRGSSAGGVLKTRLNYQGTPK